MRFSVVYQSTTSILVCRVPENMLEDFQTSSEPMMQLQSFVPDLREPCTWLHWKSMFSASSLPQYDENGFLFVDVVSRSRFPPSRAGSLASCAQEEVKLASGSARRFARMAEPGTCCLERLNGLSRQLVFFSHPPLPPVKFASVLT